MLSGIFKYNTMNKDARLIAEAYKKVLKENVEQSLGNVLTSYYHQGKGLDNETLHDVIVELEEILNVAKNDPDPASALESLLLKLKVD